jgi:hypothetical protein
MMKKPQDKKVVLDMAAVSKILRTVPSHEGFHFFKAPGDSAGKVATDLTDFVEKLRTVDIRSINFHFPRQDFEKWLREIIGDSELSRKISSIGKETHGEKLRSEIIGIVKGRIDELKGMQTKK